MVSLSELVHEVKSRIKRKAEIDGLVIEAEGLRVVGGSKKEEPEKFDGVTETEKPAEETPVSQEAVGAAPAS